MDLFCKYAKIIRGMVKNLEGMCQDQNVIYILFPAL